MPRRSLLIARTSEGRHDERCHSWWRWSSPTLTPEFSERGQVCRSGQVEDQLHDISLGHDCGSEQGFDVPHCHLALGFEIGGKASIWCNPDLARHEQQAAGGQQLYAMRVALAMPAIFAHVTDPGPIHDNLNAAGRGTSMMASSRSKSALLTVDLHRILNRANCDPLHRWVQCRWRFSRDAGNRN